jgi:hypothetical protein
MGTTGHSVRPGTKRIDICERPHELAPLKLDSRPAPMPPRRLTVNTQERYTKYRIGKTPQRSRYGRDALDARNTVTVPIFAINSFSSANL